MDLAQQVALVVVVLALLGATVRIARDRGFAQFSMAPRSSKPRRMEVLERLNLTPNHSLHLISVDGATIVVGVSPGGCHLLDKDRSEEAK